MGKIRILALGDVVGESGTLFLRERLWNIRKEKNIDAVIVNGEK